MACPQPVIETKKALETLPEGERLTLIVNTVSGRENCKRFAMSQSCAFTEESMEDGATKLVITKGAAFVSRPDEDNPIDAMIVREQKSALFVLAGAFVAALLSASCCIVPTLFLLFGVSFAGVVNVSALVEYRWLFTLAAAVMLCVGFYKMVIKKQIECDCEPSLTSKILKAIFWALFLSALAALLYPWYEGFLWGE
jgi:mercuric ion transport protein